MPVVEWAKPQVRELRLGNVRLDFPVVQAALSGRSASRVLLMVGPEGGWNDFELRLLQARSAVRVSMGQRTLRSDTAVIALLALVHAARSAHA